MEQAPFRTFEGFLKQHAHESLSPLEQEFFEVLFPAFQGKSDAAELHERARQNELYSVLSDLIHLVPPEGRPRRFAGYGLPRSRYFTLSKDAGGDDFQTLAHELRAYRDPIGVGMVEVIDLAQGCTLAIGGVEVPLEPQTALAVLVHEPQALSSRFHALGFDRLPGLTDKEIFLYRFPYRVVRRTIHRTIDLRFPDVREWFYRTFRVPSNLSASYALTSPHDNPTIAHTRFQFENGVPPVPDNFWSMLPTLVNPDLGGGSPADTGSALMMVGHWMRQHGAKALIFPSARCDAAAVFDGGALEHWQGWNLVDFEESPMFGNPDVQVTTFVLSPWAWVSLPAGVRLHVAEAGSQFAGSFTLENVVDYWAQDYLTQLRALALARSTYGREPERSEGRAFVADLTFRAFQIGALLVRWMRMAVQGIPADQIETTILELQGLALPYGLYPVTGGVLEAWEAMSRGERGIAEGVRATLAARDLLLRSLETSHPGRDFDKLARIAADLELSLCCLVGLARAGHNAIGSNLVSAGSMAESEASVQTPWLSEILRVKIQEFQRQASREMVDGGARASVLLDEGIGLQTLIYGHIRREVQSSSRTAGEPDESLRDMHAESDLTVLTAGDHLRGVSASSRDEDISVEGHEPGDTMEVSMKQPLILECASLMEECELIQRLTCPMCGARVKSNRKDSSVDSSSGRVLDHFDITCDSCRVTWPVAVALTY